jgi:hypothetical protein
MLFAPSPSSLLPAACLPEAWVPCEHLLQVPMSDLHGRTLPEETQSRTQWSLYKNILSKYRVYKNILSEYRVYSYKVFYKNILSKYMKRWNGKEWTLCKLGFSPL